MRTDNIPWRGLIWIGVAQFSLLAVAAVSNLHRLNTDAIAYLRLAKYWAEGQTHLAVSGYWGPLLSWLMALPLKLGFDAFSAARLVMAVSAVLFWIGCLSVFIGCRMSSRNILLGAVVTAAASVSWSVEYIAPDLLVAGFVCLAVTGLFAPGWLSGTRVPVLAGVLWGVAYYAKAVALPLGMAMIAVAAGVKRLTRGTEKSNARSNYALTFAVVLAMVAPWIAMLSMKYHQFTFSTTARIAHAIVGPPDFERYHPFGKHFHRPEPGRVTSWEDPSHQPYRYWSPLENALYARHQLSLIAGNALTIWQLLGTLDLFNLGVVGVLGVLVLKPRSAPEDLRQPRWLIVPLFLLAGIYLPVYVKLVDQRYFYAALPWLFAAAVSLVDLVALRSAAHARTIRSVGLAIVALSFGLPAVSRLPLALDGIPDPASQVARDLAARLSPTNITGPVAGSAFVYGNRTGLYLAFHLGQPWHGDEPQPNASGFKDSGARLIAVNRSQPIISQLDADPAFRNLDGQLFPAQNQAEAYPVKLYEVLGR